MSIQTALSSLHQTASLATFSGDALTDLLAGLAANSIGSFVISGSQSNPKRTRRRTTVSRSRCSAGSDYSSPCRSRFSTSTFQVTGSKVQPAPSFKVISIPLKLSLLPQGIAPHNSCLRDADGFCPG
jgi:hypothetical protein